MEHKTGRYRIGWLVLSTAAFTPAALGVLQTHAFIQSLGTKGILVENTHAHDGLVTVLIRLTPPLLLFNTHPVTLITTNKKWNFVGHQISAGNAAVTPSHQQHSPFHHSSDM